MEKPHPLFIRYTLLQGLFWMAYSCYYSFAAVFLLDRDFSSSEVGLLLAFSALCSVFLQPIIASIADRSQVFTLKRTFQLLIVVLAIPCILLPFDGLPKAVIAILYVILTMLGLSGQPLLSALGMQLIQNGIKFNFGLARANGSLSYAILTFFLGFIVVRFSTASLPVVALVILILMFLLLTSIPEMSNFRVNAARSDGNLQVLQKNPDFLWLIVGISLIFISHSTINNYMIHILYHIGYGQTEFGQIMSYCAMIELPAMLLITHILRKMECRKLLRFTAVAFFVKVVFTTLAPNLLLMYGASSMQAIAFAPFTPAIVYYVSEILGQEDQVKGQALVTVGITIGNTLGSLLGGFLIDFQGIVFALSVCIVLCGIGVVFFFRGTPKKVELPTQAI